jgi:hypothetical protein
LPKAQPAAGRVRGDNWLDAMKQQKAPRRKGSSDPQDGEDGGLIQKPKFEVLYKYNEGYTNAVKRVMLVRDFL